jgi:geranylgeranyl diphosphate synthase type I
MQTVVYRTGVGQMKDMYIEFAGTATEEEILRMYEDKTARYTIEAPLKIGTLLAGGNAPLENFFAHYALPLGIAFQLQDDLLGLFGQEKDLGKRVGADIIEGKFTFLMQKTWERVDETERRELKELLQRGEDITLAEIERVRTLASDSGARALTEEKVESLIQEAEGVLAREGDILDPEVHEFLSGMAAYIGKRKD